MAPTALEAPARLSKARKAFNLFAISFAFLAVFANAAIPTPLQAEYRALYDITDADISFALTIYTLGEIGVLCFMGTLSDALGRKPLTLLAMAVGAASCFAFLAINGPAMLTLARTLQGIACGLTMSAIAAWVIDSSKGRLLLAGTIIAGNGSLIGVTIGSLGVGALCVATPNHQLVYWIMIAVFAAAALLTLFTTETVRQRISLRQAIKPVVHIEPQLRGVFPIAAACYVVVWGMATYFQSYASPVCADCFGIVMPLAASILMVVANAPTAFGAPLESRFRSGLSARVAMTAFVLSCAGMAATMRLGTFIPFLVFTALFAASAGMCVAAGLRLLLARSEGLSSAKVVSTINLAGYVGTAILTALMSALVGTLGLIGVLVFLTLISAGAAALVFARTRE